MKMSRICISCRTEQQRQSLAVRKSSSASAASRPLVAVSLPLGLEPPSRSSVSSRRRTGTPRASDQHEHRRADATPRRGVGDPRVGSPHGDHPRFPPGTPEEGCGSCGLLGRGSGHRLEVRATSRQPSPGRIARFSARASSDETPRCRPRDRDRSDEWPARVFRVVSLKRPPPRPLSPDPPLSPDQVRAPGESAQAGIED